MKEFIKKFIPKSLLSLYHKALAVLATNFYGHPSKKLIVIGITGTKGKSTVANLVWHILTQAGHKTGMTSTANIRIGEEERMNPYKMTMPGRFEMQKLLKEMVDADCKYAIVETTSQGIDQWRHLGIDYKVVVFTNLYPEHLDAHGGWENYKKAKLKLFQNNPQTLIVNQDDKEHQDFYNCSAKEKIKYSLTELEDVEVYKKGLNFNLQHVHFDVPLLGKVNLSNILSAIKICQTQKITLNEMAKYLHSFKGVPGRMEIIDEGQEFTVIVDYAHEPRGLEELYQFLNKIKTNKIITVTGSCGGGRDIKMRAEKGKLADKYCDYAIVTNEDPYDDDPQEIIDQIAAKVSLDKLFKILDRREGIKKAFDLAKPGDIVVLTAKGSEQYIMGKNYKKIPWDERKIARGLLENRG